MFGIIVGRNDRQPCGGFGKNPFLRLFQSCLLAIVGLSILLPSAPVFAQTADNQDVSLPLAYPSIDGNGVDLVTGSYNAYQTLLSIGSAGSGLVYGRDFSSRGRLHFNTFTGAVNSFTNASSTEFYNVTVMGSTRVFRKETSGFVPADGGGGTLVENITSTSPLQGTITYTSADGTVALFELEEWYNVPVAAYRGSIQSLTYPSGEKLTFTYDRHVICEGSGCTGGDRVASRLMSVQTNTGYQIKFEYMNATLSDAWQSYQPAKVLAINNAVEYCDPASNGCGGLTQSWQSVTFGNNTSNVTVTDALGRATRYTYEGDQTDQTHKLTGIRRPSGTGADHITIAYDTNDRVDTISNGVGTWTYYYNPSTDDEFTRVTDPNGNTREAWFNSDTRRIYEDYDGLNRLTEIQYDGVNNRISKIRGPEGNETVYSYDTRGNVTEVRQKAKTGSTLDDIVTSATYLASCSNPKICNKPTTTTDARGKVTNYTYNGTHGGVVTVTAPPPASGAVRPKTTYTYGTHRAWTKNSSGNLVQGAAIHRLEKTASCTTLASCSGGADEVKTEITYETGSSSVGSNILPISISSGSGDNTLTSTSGFTYDDFGNVTATDGPLAGTADTVYVRYNAIRQTVGVITPDPDGASALKRRATRTTYNLDGQATKVEQGTVDGLTEANWTAFATLQEQTFSYDSIGRLEAERFKAGGVTHALVQYSYDDGNRPKCVAQRMNAALFASPPSDACALGTAGTFGEDRISRTNYDAADQVTQVYSALNTDLYQSTVKYTYTTSGLVETIADAKGNKTKYEYDGFNRLIKTSYPSKTAAGAVSTTDYEENTYDAASRVTSQRRRDGVSFSFTYDDLNRLTLKDAPTGDNDISYTYDNFGRMLTAAYTGHTETMVYDALGRMTSQTGPLGAMTYEYDIAGRMEKVTYPGSPAFYVNYDYDVLGALTAVRENGATSGVGVLATYAYDDLGRRVSLTRGNGTSTTYGYDAAGRLADLDHDLGGSPPTAHDVSSDFTYGPSGQIASLTVSNSLFENPPSYDVTRLYTVNGLNQLTQSVEGPATRNYSYDARGNLIGDGAVAYGYDRDNRLTSASGGSTFSYDPMGRLKETVGGVTTRFLYSGAQAVAEYDGSNNLQRRYVFGAGLDEVLVWYEGSGTSDRRFLVADERGSITAVTDDSGAVLQVNKYDPYGVPEAGNLGRFQYTGQMWLDEAGLYFYKNRVYNPDIGRFLQTDPIGYSDGMNLYAYVGGDPINRIDPWGLTSVLFDGDEIPLEIDEIEIFRDSPIFTGISSGLGGYAPPGSSIGSSIGGGAGGEEALEDPCGGAGENVDKGFLGPEAAVGAAAAAKPRLLPRLITRAAPALALPGLLGSGVNNSPRIPIYRAVGSAELADIYSTTPAQFRMSPSGLKQKQFFTSVSDARWYADSTAKWPGSAVAIVQTRVRLSTYQLGQRGGFADAGHQVLSYDSAGLVAVNTDAAQTGVQTVDGCSSE